MPVACWDTARPAGRAPLLGTYPAHRLGFQRRDSVQFAHELERPERGPGEMGERSIDLYESGSRFSRGSSLSNLNLEFLDGGRCWSPAARSSRRAVQEWPEAVEDVAPGHQGLASLHFGCYHASHLAGIPGEDGLGAKAPVTFLGAKAPITRATGRGSGRNPSGRSARKVARRASHKVRSGLFVQSS